MRFLWPFVRAWHQLRGDEGWGNGEELFGLIWIALTIGAFLWFSHLASQCTQ